MGRNELIKKAKALINKQAKEFYNEREQQGVDYVIAWAADFALEQIAAERRRLFEELQEGDDIKWVREFIAKEFADELAEATV